MGYRELVPHPALRPFVDRFFSQDLDASGPPAWILPDGCIDIHVHLGGRPRVEIIGTMTRAVEVGVDRTATGPIALAAVRFRPGGALPFVGIPADALTDRIETGALAWLDRRCFESPTGAAALPILQSSMLRVCSTLRPLEARLVEALRLLLAPAPPSIEAVARALASSRQHLGRLVRGHVGIGPKELQRIARMQRTVLSLQDEATLTLGQAAALHGYFDQAHMARDLRDLAGRSATAVRLGVGSIRPIRSLFGSIS